MVVAKRFHIVVHRIKLFVQTGSEQAKVFTIPLQDSFSRCDDVLKAHHRQDSISKGCNGKTDQSEGPI